MVGAGTLAILEFSVIGAPGATSPLAPVYCKLSGEYGDDLSWQNAVTTAAGSVTIPPVARTPARDWAIYE